MSKKFFDKKDAKGKDGKDGKKKFPFWLKFKKGKKKMGSK